MRTKNRATYTVETLLATSPAGRVSPASTKQAAIPYEELIAINCKQHRLQLVPVSTQFLRMTLYENKYRVESTRYPGWDCRARGWYFVTICSHLKTPLFGEVVCGQMRFSQIGAIAESELRSLNSHYTNVEVNTHVVMPNHVHVIIMIEGDHAYSPNPKGLAPPAGISPTAGSLSAIVRSYKAGVTRRSRQLGLATPSGRSVSTTNSSVAIGSSAPCASISVTIPRTGPETHLTATNW